MAERCPGALRVKAERYGQMGLEGKKKTRVLESRVNVALREVMSHVRRGECSDKFVLCCVERPELLPASLNTR